MIQSVPDSERLRKWLEQHLEFHAVLAERDLDLESLVKLDEGSILVLGKTDELAIRIEAAGSLVGQGDVVTVDGHFAVRLGNVAAARDLIDAFAVRAVSEGSLEEEVDAKGQGQRQDQGKDQEQGKVQGQGQEAREEQEEEQA